MPRYFFDTRDDQRHVRDDDGLELADLQQVKRMAARSLAELALEVLPASTERCLGVDVRDEQGHPVLTTELVFKARLLIADDVDAPGREAK
jgi:metallophosphoesterase superfamily enzyme